MLYGREIIMVATHTVIEKFPGCGRNDSSQTVVSLSSSFYFLFSIFLWGSITLHAQSGRERLWAR